MVCPLAGGRLKDQRLLQAPWSPEVDILDAGVDLEFGLTEPPPNAAVLLPGPVPEYQQG